MQFAIATSLSGKTMTDYHAKDFIETAEGLRFAVVQNGVENDKVLCFLRYLYQAGQWQKVNTFQVNQWLTEKQPQYLHYSKPLDAHLHAVPRQHITQHYQPKIRLQQLLHQKSTDPVLADFVTLCQLLANARVDLTHAGVTGSLLIATHHAESDIDLVIYQRDVFQQVRQVLANLINTNALQALSETDWQQSYARRACELSFADYCWHEQRKYNKALLHGRRIDLSLVNIEPQAEVFYQKQGAITVTAHVSDDRYSFDYPAIFYVNHPVLSSVVCFTATYNGQAQTGEWIEVAGQLEVAADGSQRVVVGSSREAVGEYIKVIADVA